MSQGTYSSVMLIATDGLLQNQGLVISGNLTVAINAYASTTAVSDYLGILSSAAANVGTANDQITSSTFSSLQSLAANTLPAITDAVPASYANTLPIGKGLLTEGAWAHFVIWSSMMFLGAVLLAMPVMIIMLFVNLGLGVATRAAPSLNIFSVGFPAMMIIGFGVLTMALPAMAGRVQWIWLQGFQEVRAQLGLG